MLFKGGPGSCSSSIRSRSFTIAYTSSFASLLLLLLTAAAYYTSSTSTSLAFRSSQHSCVTQSVYVGAYGAKVVANLSNFRSSLLSTVVDEFNPSNPQLQGHQRYEALKPVIKCPAEMPLTRYGNTGDGGKWLCDVSKLPPGCLIYSLGSNGDYSFEKDMLKATTCEIHTFDCTYNGSSQHPTRHFYHKWCVGRGKAPDFKSWEDVTTVLGHRHRTLDILKFDIEGYETFVIAELRHNRPLPRQISTEMHMHETLKPSPKTRPQLVLLHLHMASLGYAIVEQQNNLLAEGGCCAEWTFLLVEQPCSGASIMPSNHHRQNRGCDTD